MFYVYLSLKGKAYTLVEHDFTRDRLVSLGAYHSGEFAGFYFSQNPGPGGPLPFNALSKKLHSHLQDHAYKFDIPQGFSLKGITYNGSRPLRSEMLFKFTELDSIYIDSDVIHDLILPSQPFHASTLILKGNYEHRLDLLQWIQENFPNLRVLCLTVSIRKLRWDKDFPSLECFYSPTNYVPTIRRLIRTSPNLKCLYTTLERSKLVQLKIAYPRVSFLPYSQADFPNFYISYKKGICKHLSGS
ncbi:hypothetical protein DSO57_1013030 [Entomophthora muscae]|uniref:Uncharacterized protein n=1 Tax=Entomophthora muscae TaxID=34485 RepID=A0ACC2S7T9_9FUNG|nr:hypothetical protein DSO57_1013030 [Entomophthora muscae]